MTKWGQRPHWEYDAVLLGSDEHGDWLGIPAGTAMARPGATYRAQVDQVTLAPAPDLDERGWTATFHGHGGHTSGSLEGPVDVYVDITTPPVWDGAVLRAVDLDLDVVRGVSGRVWVDDEDEFAEHRVLYGYPEDVVALAVSSCEHVRTAVETHAAPYDGSAERWFARLAER